MVKKRHPRNVATGKLVTHFLPKLTVLNTRPHKQAQTLSAFLSQFGIHCLHLPTLELVATHQAKTKLICQRFSTFHTIIFTSANAVHFSYPYWPHPVANASIIAIGPGTAQALKECGLRTVILPQTYCTEGIIELPLLKNITTRPILILCGAHPHPLLKKVLTQRHAQVTLCECYQRQAPTQIHKTVLNELKQHAINAIISTSENSLKNLNRLLPTTHLSKQIPLIVISHRMELFAKQQRWKQIIVAENATSEAIYAAIQQNRLLLGTRTK